MNKAVRNGSCLISHFLFCDGPEPEPGRPLRLSRSSICLRRALNSEELFAACDPVVAVKYRLCTSNSMISGDN